MTKPDPNKWRHVEDELLRRILAKPYAKVKPSDLTLAVEASLDQLGRDAVENPASIFKIRQTIAKKFVKAMRSGREEKAHKFLQQFWLT